MKLQAPVTHQMLSLPELLEELLRYQERPIEDTTSFTWTHDKLCDRFVSQIELIGDSYLKFHYIAYNVQGPRDQGTDVILKTTVDDDASSYVAIQVKSDRELADPNLSKNLKAALHDARSHYDSRLARYYIALCGDAKKHAKRITAIKAEFAKDQIVRVMAPRSLLFFLTLPDAKLSGVVDRFLKEDDAVRKKAQKEMIGYDDFEIFFLLACLCWSFENQSDQLPTEFFLQDRRLSELRQIFGERYLDRALSKFQDSVFETHALSATTRIRAEEFRAVRALYYDVQVRYEQAPEEIFQHLYEFLKQ